MSKWIKFQQAGDTRKTKVWDVVTKDGQTLLGQIRWYPSWRKYSFFPFGNTIYENICLRNIAQFIEEVGYSWNESEVTPSMEER